MRLLSLHSGLSCADFVSSFIDDSASAEEEEEEEEGDALEEEGSSYEEDQGSEAEEVGFIDSEEELRIFEK